MAALDLRVAEHRLSLRTKVMLVAGIALGLPALVWRIAGLDAGSIPNAVIFGGGVIAASVLLAWAGEAAEVDVGQKIAIAVLALIAVLPEYAVDLALAIKAGDNTAKYAPLAAANMTGSNRLLIGVGWALVVMIGVHWIRVNRPHAAPELALDRERVLDIAFLTAATLYSLSIPVRFMFGAQELNLFDAAVLLGIFFAYLLSLRGAKVGEIELLGIPGDIAGLSRGRRRLLIALLMGFALAVILAAADRFADSLIAVGRDHHISEFLLIQWVAPLASESPELIIASLFALRGKGQLGMGTLISSKVNQWTLLVGALPVAFTVSALMHGHHAFALPLDSQQVEELFLTAAQSLMGVAILAKLTINRREAIALFVLFAVQFPFPRTRVRLGIAIAYLVIAMTILIVERRRIAATIRSRRSPAPR
jgi:cation:H+ antiporter